MQTLIQKEEVKVGDRRSIPRWNLQNRCVYRRQNECIACEGQTHNVSCSGASITTNKNLQVNERLRLTLFLSEQEMVRVSGVVVWTQGVNFQYLSGIHFVNISPESQDNILQYALNANREVVLNHWFKGWEGTIRG